MEFKGIPWAGNVYEKFEAMCLEVEEGIYEDTVKYMENQMQKVGKTVKKFYSEVMQDFLPPSCMEPVSISAEDLSPKPYAHADANKKPKLCILELKKKDPASEDNRDLTSGDKNSQLLQSCRVLVENTGSGLCSAKSMKVGLNKRPIGIKRISRTNHSPRTSGPTTCSTRDRSNLVHDTRRGCTVPSNDRNVARFLEPSVECNPEEAKPRSISVSDALEKAFTSGHCLATESQRQEEDNSELIPPASNVFPVEPPRLDNNNSECTSSFHGFPTKPIPSPSSAVTSNVCDAESLGQNPVTSYKDELMNDDLISEVHSRNTSSDGCGVESAGKVVIVSYEEYFDMELIDNKKVAEPVEKSKLEDTCIFVESDMHHLVPQGSEKHKSYKKKLREALSGKLRPTRKLRGSISLYKDSDAENNADVVIPDLTTNSSYKKSPAQDSFGSDWELI